MRFVTALVLGYPLLIRLAYYTCDVLRGTEENYKYKDGDCFMKLINETNSVHFDAHPLWSHRGYDSDCDAKEYARKQALDNSEEGLVLSIYTRGEVIAGLSYLAYSSYTAGTLPALQALAFGWVAGMNMQYTLHYAHDMTHFVGNLVHHAGPGVLTETGQGGARFKNSIPHGLLPSIVTTNIVTHSLAMLAHSAASVHAPVGVLAPALDFLAAKAAIADLKMGLQTSVAHPYLHAEGKSMFPWPLSDIIDDFNCHINQHHKDGTCLGVIDVKPLNDAYTLLMKAHAKFYSSGFVVRGTTADTALGMGVDALLCLLTYLTFYVFFRTAAAVQSFFTSTATGGKQKKVKSN